MRRKRTTAFSLLWIAALLYLSSLRAPPPEPNPFTINGVALGMSKEKVLSLFSEPPLESTDDYLVLGKRGWKEEITVYLNDEGRVRGVEGLHLELSGRSVAGVEGNFKETISPELFKFLDDPDRLMGKRGDFVQESTYKRYQLTFQVGCTGYWFYLGDTSGRHH